MKFYVDINKLNWTIEEVDTRSAELIVDNKSCFGVCKYLTQEIFIDASLKEDKKCQTLKHELTHAFLYCHLLEKKENYTEEELCEFVAIYSDEIIRIANECSNMFFNNR